MKPHPFEYVRARTPEEAVACLVRTEDAKVLAGGQSLVPLMNLRLARPGCLVDIQGLPWDGIVEDVRGGMRVGALVTHQRLVEDDVVARRLPVLGRGAAAIGHWAVRTRGTLGGSLAHADPASEMPAAMLAVGASFVLEGPGGSRQVPAAEFFMGPYATQLSPGEILSTVAIPSQDGVRWGFYEIARSAGDFALAGAWVAVGPQGGGSVTWFGVAATPVKIDIDEWPSGPDACRRWLTEAAQRLDPVSDQHAGSETRRHLAVVSAMRAFAQAMGKEGS